MDDESLTFLRFKVEDQIDLHPDEFVAWACLRLDRLQQGVRLVQLYDALGKLSDGFLLVKISKTVTVESSSELTLPSH